MDSRRKKELLQAWKERRPEMGVVFIRCEAAGAEFLGVSRDTRAWFNSHRFQLGAGSHPNRELQALWDSRGEEAFTYGVLKTLELKDPAEDPAKKLAGLLEACMAGALGAKRLKP